MAIMSQLDALSAKEGTVFFTINDKQYELAELISLEAKIEYTKADVTPLNSRMKGGKIVGAEGIGSLKMYYHRPELKAMALNYVKQGILPRIDIKCTNEDRSSRAGRYTIVLKGVLFKESLIFKLDGSADEVIDEETDFTFQDFDILSEFQEIKY